MWREELLVEHGIVVESEYLQITWEHRNEGVIAVGISGLLRLLSSRLTEQDNYLGLTLSLLLCVPCLFLQGTVEGTPTSTTALVRIRPCL